MELVPYKSETMSARLQILLETAHEANKINTNRVSLEDFLARLQQEAVVSNEAQLKQIQASLRHAPVHQASPTAIAATSNSQASQTEAATQSLWTLLPQARNQAYERGFNAGQVSGRCQGFEHGSIFAKAEGIAAGLQHGRANGLKEWQEAELQRGLKIWRHTGYDEGVAEGMKRGKLEVKEKLRDAAVKLKAKDEDTPKKIMVRVPAASPVLEKEEKTPKKIGLKLPPSRTNTSKEKKAKETETCLDLDAAKKESATPTSVSAAPKKEESKQPSAIPVSKEENATPVAASPIPKKEDVKVKILAKDPFQSLVSLARMR
ncbi:hypothetical protein EJ02DRAFT_486470 [Clathrospora elynae]|uniref:Essential protein Yae1 N-terminal domain-containing protein n=1 Tax=Clathrospora elynae TaxID=706981 RepID=A0A6A5SCP7_9PLEO|nr:hypothetical protein EJ02DRAFT_486470 [Clathrospora elynae]